jgi:hypothetical protein
MNEEVGGLTSFNDIWKIPRLHLIAHLVGPFPAVGRTVYENEVTTVTHFVRLCLVTLNWVGYALHK